MLQIVTRMYFSDGVPVRSTVHRDVLYTNCTLLRTAVVELRVGQLAPSTSLQPVSSVTLSVTEHLEAEEPDGTAGDARRDGRNRTDRRGPLTAAHVGKRSRYPINEPAGALDAAELPDQRRAMRSKPEASAQASKRLP